MMKPLFYCFLLLILNACATPQTNQEYRAGIQRWGKVTTVMAARPLKQVVADVDEFVNQCYYRVTTTTERDGMFVTQSTTTQKANWENDLEKKKTLVIRKQNARVVNQAKGGNYFYMADFEAKSAKETELTTYQMSMGYDFNADIIATAQGQKVRCSRPGLWDM